MRLILNFQQRDVRMREFKVGDRVTVKDHSMYYSKMVGIITDIDTLFNNDRYIRVLRPDGMTFTFMDNTHTKWDLKELAHYVGSGQNRDNS